MDGAKIVVLEQMQIQAASILTASTVVETSTGASTGVGRIECRIGRVLPRSKIQCTMGRAKSPLGLCHPRMR